MRRTLCLLVAMALSACAGLTEPDGASAPRTGEAAVSRADGQTIGRERLAARLERADIVILGEIHDNAAHHRVQAWIVGALRPAGLAFEMIPEASEEGIAVYLAEGGDPGGIGPAIGWERLGWPDWALYRPVFEAHRAAVYTGGALPRSQIRAAAGAGAADVLRHPAFVPALRAPFPAATQGALEAEMVAAHCGHLPASAAPGMVEIQRLRDASFAAAAMRARQRTGGQVVLITGNGHARRDSGVPYYLARTYPDLDVVSVGLLEGAPDAGTAALYDYTWVTPAQPRGDPCAAFRGKG